MIAGEMQHYTREPRPPPLPERRDESDRDDYLTTQDGLYVPTGVSEAPSYVSIIPGDYSDVRASTMDDSYLKPMPDNDIYLEPVTDTYLNIR